MATQIPRIVIQSAVSQQRNLMDCELYVLHHMHFAMNIVQLADMNTHLPGDMIVFRAIIHPELEGQGIIPIGVDS